MEEREFTPLESRIRVWLPNVRVTTPSVIKLVPIGNSCCFDGNYPHRVDTVTGGH